MSSKRNSTPTCSRYDNQQTTVIFDRQGLIPTHHVVRVIDQMIESVEVTLFSSTIMVAPIYSAVERKRPGADHDGYIPEQKLSRFEAIQLYTIGSSQAINKEHERGYIKPGYVADFTIFDRDLFDGTTDEMLTAKALKTVVAGRVVFERET